jgi:hypothetical protein
MESEWPVSQVLRVLREGNMQSLGLMPWGSNYTFLVQVTDNSKSEPEPASPSLRRCWKTSDNCARKCMQGNRSVMRCANC